MSEEYSYIQLAVDNHAHIANNQCAPNNNHKFVAITNVCGFYVVMDVFRQVVYLVYDHKSDTWCANEDHKVVCEYLLALAGKAPDVKIITLKQNDMWRAANHGVMGILQ